MSVQGNRLCHIDFSKYAVICSGTLQVDSIFNEINSVYNIPNSEYYLLKDGKKVTSSELVSGNVCFVPRVLGGKGGFGSMLRAIGAQIEKTTNREACRDLSGRRLRDINEEQRLKNWIAQQGDREQEAAERKKLKLEKLCREPKHDFKDELYEKERSELCEKVSDSVEEGLKKTSTSGSSKRTGALTKDAVKKKKKKLLIDMDDEFSSTDSEVEENTSTTTCKSKHEGQSLSITN